MANDINKNGSIYIKQGGFYYNVSGNDALILNKYLGYKLYGVNQFRTGFPVNGQDTVLKKIDKLHMNYEVYDQDGCCVTHKEFEDNCYEIIDPANTMQITGESSQNEGKEYKKISSTGKFQNYISILESLSEGINFATGEIIEGLDEELKDYLLEIAMYFDTMLKNKEKFKSNNPSQGKRWTKEEEEQLINEFNSGIEIKEIAKIHQRSFGSVFIRLSKHFNLGDKIK
jgi:hypothetical protein